MANELHSYDFWFHSTANPLYTNMRHESITAEPAHIRQVVTDFCIENEGYLDSYGFLYEVNGKFICPELDDSYEWEDLETQFRNGWIGFYFYFYEQELGESKTIQHFIEELQSMILMEAMNCSLPTP